MTKEKIKRDCVLCGKPLHYVNKYPKPELIELIVEGEKKVNFAEINVEFGAVCCECHRNLGLPSGWSGPYYERGVTTIQRDNLGRIIAIDGTMTLDHINDRAASFIDLDALQGINRIEEDINNRRNATE